MGQYKAMLAVENLVKQTPQIPDERKQEILDQLQQARTPLESDKWIYRMVVGSLGLAILSCLFFSFLLVWRHMGGQATDDIRLPEIFMAIGSAGIGALAGLLAPSPVQRSGS
jgi:hypothetical protein